jgi:hypothetical protein
MPLINPLFPNRSARDTEKHDADKLAQMSAFRESAEWLAAEAQRESDRAMAIGDTKESRELWTHAEQLVDTSEKLMEESMRLEER